MFSKKNKKNILLTDVSLRDGIQNAKVENFPTSRKKEIFRHIFYEYSPTNIEIGSLANPKILPIMSDTMEFFDDCIDFFTKIDEKERKNIYVLLPTIKKWDWVLKNNIQYISFITSVSDEFQKKNTNKTLEETKMDFYKIFGEPGSQKITKKLYISCIDRCPMVGKIENDFIVNEIVYYYREYLFDELCLSDTCGELEYENFRNIVEKCRNFGIPMSKFSLHLHVSPEKKENLEKILFYCFFIGINKFDVSYLETGGCSVTMESSDLHQNLSYELFYEILETFENMNGKIDSFL